MPRLLSWFGGGKASYNAARKALKQRKDRGIKHHLVKIHKKNGNVEYYVGAMHQITGLKKRFKVEAIKG